MGKTKSGVKSGTILKVPTGDFEHLSEADLKFLWNQHNDALKTFEEPKERYTKFLSELIGRVRDTTARLIQAGAIEGVTVKDTAIYVRNALKLRGIPMSNHFYQYFKPDQKRDWQTDEDPEKLKNSHRHEFFLVKIDEDLGEIKRCGDPCNALMIEGKVFQHIQEETVEPELAIRKPKTSFEEENEELIEGYESVISTLKAVVGVWRITESQLTLEEKMTLSSELYKLKLATEFVNMAHDRKNLIAPFVLHLLCLAYAEATQKHAGGLFLMKRIDLAKRKHGEAVKDFTTIGQFAKLLSGKQTTKAMKGKIKTIHERNEPLNEKGAQDAGFSGQQCTECKYFRVGHDQVRNPDWKDGDPVHEKFDTVLVCFHCFATQKRVHYILPKQLPEVTIDYQSSTHNSNEGKEVDSIKG